MIVAECLVAQGVLAVELAYTNGLAAPVPSANGGFLQQGEIALPGDAPLHPMSSPDDYPPPPPRFMALPDDEPLQTMAMPDGYPPRPPRFMALPDNEPLHPMSSPDDYPPLPPR